MGDMGDDFRAWKEHKSEKKNKYRNGKMKEDIQSVRNFSAHIDEKNDGEHFIVTAESGAIVDYWPSTKRWIARRGKSKGYDVLSLVAYLKKQIVKKNYE